MKCLGHCDESHHDSLQTKIKECEALEAKLRRIETRVDALETQMKDQEKNLNNEEFLFTKSAVYKRLTFKVWLHHKYHQLHDSEGPNPHLGDVEELNRELQRYIPSETYFFGIKHDETYYVEKLNELNRKMSSWVRGISDAHEEFNEHQIQLVLHALKKLSRTGEKTVQVFEEQNLISKFTSKRHYRTLCTHLISLAIYEHILSSFAFGMDRISSKQLYAIQNSILTHGMAPRNNLLTN